MTGILALAWCCSSAAGADSAAPALTNVRAVGVRTAPAAELARAIPGRFVITLQPRVDPSAVAREHGVQPDFIYTRVITGFAGSISDAARSGLLRDNRVVRVEPDRPIRAKAVQSWGIDRLDQRRLPLDGRYGVSGGRGVSVYVVDSGIRLDHTQFEGRAVRGYDAIGDGRNGSDCNGHGTHVAGSAGGASIGVASDTRLVSVRVLDCEGAGATSGLIAGLDWIAQYGQRPGVVNISVGAAAHSSTDDAVRRLYSLGFPVVVAAGNESADACLSSPARVAEAITIAASTDSDARPSWSNYGSCVDMFAPGEGIVSAWHTSTTAGASASGTSMATPHAAGAAALLLGSNSSLSPKAVRDSLYQSTTKDAISTAASANDHLLFVGSATSSTSGVTIEGTATGDVIDKSRTAPGQPLATDYADIIRGHGGNDRLGGAGGDDRIEAGAGDDVVFGGRGSDSLYGGLGRDRFHFSLAPQGDVDSIRDFTPGQDLMYLDSRIFPAAGPVGPLSPDAFRQGTSAADSSDRILYDPGSGNILYDPDGTGPAARVRLAKVTPGIAVSAASFRIY